MACENSEVQQQKIIELEQRIARLEAVFFPQQTGKVIQPNARRNDVGMGALLNDSSDFL